MRWDLPQILQVTSWMFQGLTQQQQHLLTVDIAIQGQVSQGLLTNECQTEVLICFRRGDIFNPRKHKKEGLNLGSYRWLVIWTPNKMRCHKSRWKVERQSDMQTRRTSQWNDSWKEQKTMNRRSIWWGKGRWNEIVKDLAHPCLRSCCYPEEIFLSLFLVSYCFLQYSAHKLLSLPLKVYWLFLIGINHLSPYPHMIICISTKQF